MYLSIDFEDPHHDLKRSLGICESGQIKTRLEVKYDATEITRNYSNLECAHKH